ncbi:MAG: hypothetical protein U5L96_18990 [Owenweeksia sp.]|nr:hypothetical protein [Owenweeksia sp.]
MKKSLLLLAMLPAWLAAQNFSYLAGARSAALAHCSVAFTDIWAGHHNQAGLAFLEKPSTGISLEKRYFLHDLNLAQASFAYPGEWGSLGLSFSYFGFELYNQSKLGLNYARAFGKYFSLGLQINYHQFYVSEGSGNGGAVSFETGFIAKPIPKLAIGFHLFNPSKNYQNSQTNQRLPLIGRMGAHYKFSESTGLSIEVRKNMAALREAYALGLEYAFLKNLWLRTGVGLQPFRNTFGLGLDFDDFTADLSYEYAQVLGSNANLSLQYAF